MVEYDVDSSGAADIEDWSTGVLDKEVLSNDVLEEEDTKVVEDSEIRVLVGVWTGDNVLVLVLEPETGVLSDVLALAGICETGAEITSGSATSGAVLPVASWSGVVFEEPGEIVLLGAAL